MTTIVQIYEIQTAAEASQMAALGVDHIGSVLMADPGGPRGGLVNEELLAAVRTVQQAGRKSSLIPLFTDFKRIVRAIDIYKPDIVHLCDLPGSDQAALTAALELQKKIRRRFEWIEIMRSIPIAPEGMGHAFPSLSIAAHFEPASDWFLTDTLLLSPGQPVEGFVGITGRTCDWSIARELVSASRIPVILAGGIGPENVSAGLSSVRPAGVDSCTRTNAADDMGRPVRFRKDPLKVRGLVEAVRRWPAD